MQLIDGTRFFKRMTKSLNNKRNEITEDQIRELTRIYGNGQDGETADVRINGDTETRVVSRIFENREFGFLKVTVERPLRMNFEAAAERIAKLDGQRPFINLAGSADRWRRIAGMPDRRCSVPPRDRASEHRGPDRGDWPLALRPRRPRLSLPARQKSFLDDVVDA
ncbi:hypothetical protein MES5069_750110 [Mesorhizobium escarrei]|uniref:Uncharacterized protein n=1 Tax=Mesorhizobium escarrei TaxID=666018 RepID=A0ABN8KFS3_9HYPH|nr:hypothetical protein MES5069_750110 [Mesorhizobium escarrei]